MSRSETQRSEKAILNDTLVQVSALPETCIWRHNTGTAWQGQRMKFYPGTAIPVPPGVVVLKEARPITFGLPGSADVIGAHRGRPLAVETKTERGPQREAQKRFEAAWVKAGGVYLLVRSPEEALQHLTDS